MPEGGDCLPPIGGPVIKCALQKDSVAPRLSSTPTTTMWTRRTGWPKSWACLERIVVRTILIGAPEVTYHASHQVEGALFLTQAALHRSMTVLEQETATGCVGVMFKVIKFKQGICMPSPCHITSWLFLRVKAKEGHWTRKTTSRNYSHRSIW